MRACVRPRRFRRLFELSILAFTFVAVGAMTAAPARAQSPVQGPLAPTVALPLQVGGLFGFAGTQESDPEPAPAQPLNVQPAAPATQPQPGTPLADLLSLLEQYVPNAGEWSNVPGTEFDAARLPDNEATNLGIKGGVGSEAVLTGRTGAAYDHENHQWYFWGGGGSNYGGNEIYRLDLELLQITQITQPSVLDNTVSAGGGASCDLPSDGPSAAETYDGIIWSPTTQSFFVFPANTFCPGATLAPAQVWEFDPAFGTWSAVASLASFAGQPVFAEYDPVSDEIIVISGGASAQIRTLNPSTGQLSAPVNLGQALTSGSAVLNPVTGELLVLSQEGVFAVSLTNFGDITRLADLPAGLDPHSGAAFDTTTGLLVVWDGDTTVHTFDPSLALWATHDSASGPSAPNGDVFSKWILVDELDIFVGYHNPAEGLWLYRLPANPGPAPANRSPVADAGADETGVPVGASVTLNGAGSFDPDADLLTYSWQVASTPSGSNPTVTNPNSAVATFVPDKVGTYDLRLTVSDGALSDSDLISVTVVNSAPVADAGPDQTLDVGQTATLDGSASADADGHALTYQWTLVSKPSGSTASLSDPSAAGPTLMLDAAGAFLLHLVVHDGIETSTADAVTITAQAIDTQPAGGGDSGSGDSSGGGGTTGGSGNVIDLFAGNSFEAAVESLQPGDTLVVHAGTYSETGRISIQVQGTAQAPVVIKAAEGEARPLITRPSSASVQNTINVEGASYLTISGLEITGNGGDGIKVEAGPSHITLEDLEVHEVDVGLSFQSSMDNITVRNNHIYHTGIDGGTGEGMYVGCNNASCIVRDSLFENNWIHDSLPGTTQGDGIEIKPGSHSNVVRNNVIHDMNYPCIFVYGGGADVNVVEGNVLWNCNEAMQIVSDAVVRNNIVFNSVTGITAAPHAQVAGVSNVTIVNNTFYGHSGECLYIRWSNATNMVLANNAVYCPGDTAVNAQGLSGGGITISANYVEGGMSGASIDNAGFFSGGAAAGQFTDPAGFDFWPTDTSVLLDAADPGFAPEFDFNGTARTSPQDVGAYEAEGLTTNPGWKVADTFKGTEVADSGTDGSSGGGAPTNTAPVADAGADQSVDVGQTATLQGGGSSDADGDSLTYAWTLVSKPSGSSANLSNATSQTPTLTLDAAGAFLIQLVVNDGLANSAADTVEITAQAIDTQPAGSGGAGGDEVVQVPTQADWVDRGVVFTAGPAGSWDTQLGGAFSPCGVVKKDGTYFLYYIAGGFTGSNGDARNRALGVATSSDGLSFTKYTGNPIMTPAIFGETYGPTGEGGIDACAVELDAGGDILLYYGAMFEPSSDVVHIDIRLARSSNGFDFADQGEVLAYDDSSVWGYGDELGPMSTFVGNDNSVFLYYICLNGNGCKWDLGLASGPSRTNLPSTQAVLSEVKQASAVRLSDTTGALFATKNGSWDVEVRTFPMDDPSDLSGAPVATYDFNSVLPTTHNSSIFPGIEFSHNTVFLDREAGTWFLYYHLGDPQDPDMAVMTAPVVTEASSGSGSSSNTSSGSGSNTGAGSDPVDTVSGVQINNTQPSSYVWDALEVGRPVYIDRSYTYSAVPSAYDGLAVLRTANNDKGSSGSAFVTFEVSEPVTVYVAHDVRITAKPAWLSGWTATGDALQTTAPDTLALYRKDFPAGTVTLGGNQGDGFSMYTVLLNVAGTPAADTGSGGTTTSGSSGGSTGGSSGGGTVITSSSLSQLAASLAPGQWGELQTNNINSALSASGASDMTIGYSEEMKWNPVTRQLQFVGSDHGDCTKFVVYDEATNRWTDKGKPAWVSCITNHGYDHMAVDPATGDLFSRVFRTGDLYRWDGSQWRALPTLNFGYTGAAAVGLEYFPEMDGLVWASVESGTLGSVFLWERKSNSWKRLTSASLPMGDPHQMVEYNPVHKVVVFGGGNGSRDIYSLDAQGNIRTLTRAPYGVGSGNASRFTVDPVSGDFLVFFDNGEFWVYDYPSDSWTKQNVNIPSSARTTRYGNPIFGVVTAPIAEYGVNVFVACDGADCHVTVYKHSQGAGGGSGGSTGGGSTGGGSTGGGTVVTDADFAAACAEADVILCRDFDTLPPDAWQGNEGIFVNGYGNGCPDSSDWPSNCPVVEDGRLKFTFASNSGASAAGQYFVKFPEAEALPGDSLYVRWEQEFDSPFLNEASKAGDGFKVAQFGDADQTSCASNEIVISNVNNRGFPIAYHACGRYEGFDTLVGRDSQGNGIWDYQPGGPKQCLLAVGQSPETASDDCFKFAPNETFVFEVAIDLNPDPTQPSRFRMWLTRDSRPRELVIDYSRVLVDAIEGYGSVWLQPYNTGKQSSIAHPEAHTWVNNLLIARRVIPDGQ